jgi:RNA polymerase sigma factor (sigma-70 family)
LKIIYDKELVEDCIHEVFIQLIDNKRKIIFTPKIHLYLFKSLRNKLYEELRTKSRKDLINKKIADSENIIDLGAEKTIIEKEKNLAQKEILNNAVNLLSERQKEVIYLKFSEGLDYPEIADLLKIDIASARTLVYRSIKCLKGNLKDGFT